MNKRTYELIGKWVARQHNIQIVFGNYDTASADCATNTIHMPLFVNECHACAALALLIHEAGHLRWTKPEVAPQMISRCQTEQEKMVLNCIEDARIDHKSFDLLPNVRAFFIKLYSSGNKRTNVDPRMAALMNCIFEYEGLDQFKVTDPETEKLESAIWGDFRNGVYYLSTMQWAKAHECVKCIIEKLFPPPPPPTPSPQPKQGESNEETEPEDTNSSNGEQNSDTGSTPKKPLPSDGPNKQPVPSAEQIGASIEQYLHPTEIFAKGELPDEKVTPIVLQEQTVKLFKELLDTTEKHVVDDGSILDTGELTSYATGDLESLFKDDISIKSKKSKMYFLLDTSGSMSQNLMDGTRRWLVVSSTMARMEDILKEVQEVYGLDVAYEVYFFDERLYGPFTDWKQRYTVSDTGTELCRCLKQLLANTHADFDTDGKRMVIVITDGAVHKDEIEEVKAMCSQEAQDIRVMFVPVGASPAGPFVEIITNGRTILEEGAADQVILETIIEML